MEVSWQNENIKREYQSESTNGRALIVSFGYHNKFFTIDNEFRKNNDCLSLRDPYCFLFYRGLTGDSTLNDLEVFLRNEIEIRKPSRIIFTSLCVTSFVAMALGFKLKVDAIICFSPWTHWGPQYSAALQKTFDNDPNCYVANIFRSLVTMLESDQKFINTMKDIRDINAYEDKMGKTKLLLFFTQGILDQIAKTHISDGMKNKINIYQMNATNMDRTTIRKAILDNVEEWGYLR